MSLDLISRHLIFYPQGVFIWIRATTVSLIWRDYANRAKTFGNLAKKACVQL